MLAPYVYVAFLALSGPQELQILWFPVPCMVVSDTSNVLRMMLVVIQAAAPTSVGKLSFTLYIYTCKSRIRSSFLPALAGQRQSSY